MSRRCADFAGSPARRHPAARTTRRATESRWHHPSYPRCPRRPPRTSAAPRLRPIHHSPRMLGPLPQCRGVPRMPWAGKMCLQKPGEPWAALPGTSSRGAGAVADCLSAADISRAEHPPSLTSEWVAAHIVTAAQRAPAMTPGTLPTGVASAPLLAIAPDFQSTRLCFFSSSSVMDSMSAAPPEHH
eukprot:scaffold8826_cov117-Isochrysis_galbana.AAC.5